MSEPNEVTREEARSASQEMAGVPNSMWTPEMIVADRYARTVVALHERLDAAAVGMATDDLRRVLAVAEDNANPYLSLDDLQAIDRVRAALNGRAASDG